jgi:c-di-GMP phosphodiesterase
MLWPSCHVTKQSKIYDVLLQKMRLKNASFRKSTPKKIALSLTACLVGLGFSFISFIAAKNLNQRAIENRELSIASDLVLSIDRVLGSVSIQHRSTLLSLVGNTCNEQTRASLAASRMYVRYVRAVILVKRGRGYCSSGLGLVDLPVSENKNPESNHVQIKLLSQTKFQPGSPVVSMFYPLNDDIQSGLLYIIEGDYIADILKHGIRSQGETSAILFQDKTYLTHENFFPRFDKRL